MSTDYCETPQYKDMSLIQGGGGISSSSTNASPQLYCGSHDMSLYVTFTSEASELQPVNTVQ